MRESEIEIELDFEGNHRLSAMIDRVRGPLIVEEIMARLPLQGKTAYLAGEMKITLGIGMGNLKASKQVKRGEIAYVPLGDSLSIYLRDMNTFSPVNVIGTVTSSAEALDKVQTLRRGGQVTIRLVEYGLKAAGRS